MFFLLTIFSILLSSCGSKLQPVLFPVQGTEQTLLGLGREAAEGSFDLQSYNLSQPKRFEYRFTSAAVVSPPASFEIEYSLAGERQVMLKTGNRAWVLPGDDNFIVHYAIPVDDTFSDFDITLAGDPDENRNEKIPMRIYSVKFTERWYGYASQQGSEGNHLYISPFVSRWFFDSAWFIDMGVTLAVPAGFSPVLSAIRSSESSVGVDMVGRRIEARPRLQRLNIPSGMIVEGALSLTGEPASFRVSYASLSVFPAPITADPGLILAWPVERWRDRRYEFFRWENFPSLLIFDTANYAVQDRLFKRLAFFVEKAGFRGRLAPDEEIADLHGWNAHDYRAEDLARFFNTARQTNFPLLTEERELERILLDAGIIRESSTGIVEGEGGVISISRESAEYLRFRFMAHEGFHGIFFIDEDFRDFTRRRWQQFPADAKRFLISFFNYQRYDTDDEYLLINEFMAHILQQPVSQAGRYFGQDLPSRLEETWRKAHLPAKNEVSGSWPTLATAFTREAEAFSAYVNNRWGLSAGQVHLVTVRQGSPEL
jgi:hypothetical protein